MLEYKMKVDFEGGRWFQVEVVASVSPSGFALEFSLSENPLTVNVEERAKIVAAVATAEEAIARFIA